MSFEEYQAAIDRAHKHKDGFWAGLEANGLILVDHETARRVGFPFQRSLWPPTDARPGVLTGAMTKCR